MNVRFKKLFTSARFWVLVAFILLSLIAINQQFGVDGITIRSVQRDSAAALAGMQSPEPGVSPTHRERILEVNSVPITDVAQFYDIVDSYPANTTFAITTTDNTYRVTLSSILITDPETNETRVSGTIPLGLILQEPATNNLRLGLDLSGGTRVILQPKERVSEQDLTLVMDNIKERLNVYGLSDIIVRSARDLSGDDFIIVEIAGADKDEVRDLLSRQGKFEASIANQTVFRGGQDITYVCRTAECSGIDRNTGCGQTADGAFACRFSFEIQLSPEAAQRQADVTRNLTVRYDGTTQGYLSSPIDLYLDDELVDSLQIAEDLKGRAATSILISGSGAGPTQQAAAEDAIANMKQLQTVLVTGSLPVQLTIVKTDGISPALGSEFVKNALLLGLLSTLVVAIVIVVRYRKPIISIPIIITMLAEVTIVLGFAAAVGWNLDLAAIAAIVIAIGSGVNDQIILIDEMLSGVKSERQRSWKEKLGSAFFIIFAAYFTLAAAMIPLFFAGAGLLRGFAITTIVGITAGVLITRPAFAYFIELLLKRDEEE